MNCRDLLGAISDYLDDEERVEICKQIERHLTDCPHCRVHVDTLRGTVALVREKGNGRCCESVVVRLKTRILSGRTTFESTRSIKRTVKRTDTRPPSGQPDEPRD